MRCIKMVAAISQKTKMIEQVITCEGDSIHRCLQQITQDIQNSLISSAEKKGSLNLVGLKEQVEGHRVDVLKKSSIMFGTY